MRAGPIHANADSHRASMWQRLLWGLLWLALAVFAGEFLHAVYLKYAVLDSPAYGMFLSRRGWLWCHLGGGAVGLALGTLQFVTQRWHGRLVVHRWVGRGYGAGMLVAMVGAAGLIATSPAPPAIRIAFAATSLAWLATATVGYVAIRRRRHAAHRRWMLRAYLVTLAPVLFRIALPTAIGLGITPSPGIIAALLWASWMLPLLVHALLANAAGRSGLPALARAARDA
jgi:hypothetical protein